MVRKDIVIFGVSVLCLFYGFKAFAGTLSCSITSAAACTSPNVIILRMSGASNAHAELPSQSTAAYANNVVCCGGVANLSNSCSGSYTTVLQLSNTTNAHVQQSGSYPQSACISLPSGTAPTVAYIPGNQSCTPTYDDTLLSMSAASNAHVGNETAYNNPGNYKVCATAGTTSVIVSISVADGVIAYGAIPANSTKSTCTSELNDAQTVTNDGNVAENFNIRGQNSANWTLGATPGSNIYVHKFLNGACSTFSGGTALTTSYTTLATGIAASSSTNLNLQINTPNPSTVFTQQSVDVTIQAVQQ